MHLLLKQTSRWFILLLLITMAGSTHAQSVIILKKLLDGSKSQLAKDSSMTVKDSVYFDVTLLPKLDTPYSVKNIVTFRINEYSRIVLPTEFTASVDVRIIYTKPDFSVDSITKTLSLNYKATASYSSRNSFVFNNAHQVKIKVLGVTITAASDILPALVLENELDVHPVYKLSCTDDAVKTIGAVTPSDTADEIKVYWTALTGADDYDLEWAYIDSSAIVNNKYGNPVVPALIFRNNATRVTVADNSYSIPLIYDNGGILFFRVRGVLEKAKNVRLETSWSSDFTGGGLGQFSYKGHERLLNWQSTINFAEDGKRKVVVQYYDGSLRSRQTVTKDNSTNTDVVAESFYDYQGRPVVQVLPAPTLNTAIKYFSSFNTKQDGTEYDKSNYDSLGTPSDFLTASASPMSTASGANQYYSPLNPQNDNGFNRFIPDAGGFAFTETSYTQDNTGRINRQGGVGPVYRLGSNHETRYAYGSPGDNDLDVLFGTDAGDKTHYFKNTVQDANGQYAVSYVDMHGRTIATALAGTPDSANLANLSYNNVVTYTDTLSRVGRNVIKDLVMETTQSQLVTVDGDYNFKYVLTTPVLQLNDCTPTPVKYNVLYDLEIKITDDANNQRPGMPFDRILHNYTPGTNPAANAPLQNIIDSFTVHLTRGNYEISKRLTVSNEALAYYRDSIFGKRNICTTFDQFINQQRQLLVNTQCVPDCQTCRTNIGTLETFRANYITTTGITNPDDNEVSAAYADAVAACDDLCGTTSQVSDIRNGMLLDVSPPSGQYADPSDTSNIYSIFYNVNDRVLPPYQQPSIVYLNEGGRPDTVYDELTNSFVLPQSLKPEQFAAKFKASWAPALLKFHPEYCKYLVFQQFETSYKWDRDFELVDDYTSAISKSYLNPTGILNLDLGLVDTSALDPIISQSTVLSRLNARLNNYGKETTSANIISIWSLATTVTKCDGTDASCQTLYNTPAKAFSSSLCTADLDMAWRNFRQLYLTAKHDILDSIINVTVCPVTAAQLVTAGYKVNFNTATDALSQNGLSYLSNKSTSAASKDSVRKAMLASYASNCQSYVNAWISQLAPCKYSTKDLNDSIIPRLLMVCKEGADSSHPYGASSVSPVSTYSYKTFQQVLDKYNAQHNILDPWVCNAYLVTAPAPYDKQPAYANKPVYSKPEPCECTKLNNLWREYIANKITTDASFAVYLTRTKGIKMTDEDLTTLLNACNNTSSCTYLSQDIMLPPALQCNSGEICVTCSAVDSLYNKFMSKYSSSTPSIEVADDDTVQLKKNQLFENFMNNQLGFSKQAWEYLSFRTQCQGNNSSTGTTATDSAARVAFNCTQLTNIKQTFLSLYPISEGGTLTVNKTLPLSTVTHIYSTGAVANTSIASLAALVRRKDSTWYALRDNAVFNFSIVAKDAWIDSASLNLYAKSQPIEAYTIGGAHYSEPGDTVSAYFERALGTVISGTTTWNTLPAVTSENRLVLSQLPAGSSNSDYLNPSCAALVRDMLQDYQNGKNNGLIFRLTDETLNNKYRGYGFWANRDLSFSKPSTITVKYTASRLEEFTAYLNEQLKINYTSTQVKSLYLSVCGSNLNIGDSVDYPVYNGLLLCGKSEPLFGTVKDSINNCSDSAYIVFNKATDLFNAYRDSLKGSFEQAYIDTSLIGGQREIFTVNYSTSEYHYTLYYYDQAGNLVKTVPPAGVVIDRSVSWCAGVRAARAAGLSKTPAHNLVTEYRYNTLNQVISQKTPDGSIANFWYDRLGRLAISQNKKQLMMNAYSYTTYDALGRISEVGEITSSTAMTNATSRDTTLLAAWLNDADTTRTQITNTTYDIGYSPFYVNLFTPINLRNRVSWTALYNSAGEQNAGQYTTATFYSYDIHGNVDTLLQDYKQGVMRDGDNRWKRIVYNYDLISGKVNRVAYQPGQLDAFYHRYSYDAENRITNVETSHDSIYWENDAYYQYYKHGPLARTIIGQQQVQGLDYAYTLQGWLKGVNSTAMTPAYDMGGDGATGSLTAKDIFGFALHYFGSRDYSPVSTTVNPFAAAANLNPLFNGNIAAISQHLPSLGTPLQYNYSYDVLNRLVGMQVSQGLNTTTNAWTPVVLDDFKESVSYDANGNILSYRRNGDSTFASKPLAMDNLTYTYKTGTNRLDFVADSVVAINYENDLDTQSAGNYEYDSIGNITRDVKEGIDSISWTVYGKIRRIKKSNGITIDYTYDVAGNRISKRVNGVETWYVRDATGNVMGIYTKGDSTVNSGVLSLTETHLYGSSRLGISTLNINVASAAADTLTPLSGLGSGININFIRGKKFFELSNHLGNVLATVSDKKIGISVDSTTIDHYEADIVSSQEYYPFGMQMPGRGYNSSKYRYGFNGKENDNEVKGEGNQQDYGMRVYDSRVGKFLSLDPLQHIYPMLTPYQYAGNGPISGIDLDGKEFEWFMIEQVEKKIYGTTTLKTVREGFVERAIQTGKDAYNSAVNSIPKDILKGQYGSGSTTLMAGLPPNDPGPEGQLQSLQDKADGIKNGIKAMYNDYHDLASKAVKGNRKAIGALGFEAALMFVPVGEEAKIIQGGFKYSKTAAKLVEGTALVEKEIVTLTKTGTKADALAVAKEIIGNIPENAEVMSGKFGSQQDGITGFRWVGEDGLYKELRLDFDTEKGAHYNWKNGKQKGAIQFNSSQEQVERMIRNEVIKADK